jgi:hypothetical protein
LCQNKGDLTIVDTIISAERARALQESPALFSAQQALAETVDECAIGRREIVKEAVDGFDDDAPLRKSCDGAQGVEASLHFDGDPNAQLRVVLDLLPFSGTSWRTACAADIFHATVGFYAIVGHARERWRRTAEIRELRCVSDACEVCVNTSDNVIPSVFARRDPTRVDTASQKHRTDRNSLTNAQFGHAAVSSTT